MKVLVLIPLLIVWLCQTGTANVNCGFYSCETGQRCCGWGCIPENTVCCSSFYCELGHKCCGSFLCCVPGAYCVAGECKRCDGGNCNNNNPTTKKIETTPKPFTTKSVRTTRKPFTTKSIRTTPKSFTTRYARTTPREQTTRWFVTRSYRQTSSSTTQFRWWHGMIIAALTVIIVAIVIALFVWKRRTTRPNGSNGGRVLSLPSQPVNRAHATTAITANTGVSPNSLQTGNVAVGYTRNANGTKANVLPNTQQHLVVTKTGVPQYNINTGYSSDENKEANVKGYQ